MAFKYSSSGNSAMKASLVLMLLFGAVVVAQAQVGRCVNKTCKEIITADGIKIPVNQSRFVRFASYRLAVSVLDDRRKNVTLVAEEIPKDVFQVDCVIEAPGIKFKVSGLRVPDDEVQPTRVGTVLGSAMGRFCVRRT